MISLKHRLRSATLGGYAIALSFLQPITQQLALPLWFKGLTEVIDRTE
jgi:hypothetical protein